LTDGTYIIKSILVIFLDLALSILEFTYFKFFTAT